MLVPQTAEYALRAMACLSHVPPDRRLTAKQLSEQASVPPHYMSKILRRLVNAHLIEAQKGPGGGVTLGRPAAEIRFIDIFAALDFQPKKRECAFGWGKCDEDRPCPLHNVWSRLEENFFRWAENATLADTQPIMPRDLVSLPASQER